MRGVEVDKNSKWIVLTLLPLADSARQHRSGEHRQPGGERRGVDSQGRPELRLMNRLSRLCSSVRIRAVYEILGKPVFGPTGKAMDSFLTFLLMRARRFR